MSIQSNINNILSLTGLIAAGTEARREKRKEKKAEQAREAAIRGDESIVATLGSVEGPKPTETSETQQTVADTTEYDDLLEVRQHRSSGSPLARERTRQIAQELGMTEAQFATAMSQSNMSQIRERAALRRALGSQMTPEDRIRTAALRQRAAEGDAEAFEEIAATTGGPK